MDRQLKCSIAKDNGRAEEFIRKRVYPDKSRCYECGEVGHLSYQCSKNSLGEREPPKKNRKSRKKDLEPLDQASADDEDDREASEGEDPALDSLGAASLCTVRLGDNCSAKWLPCCRHLPMILSNLTKKSFRFLSKFFQMQLAAYFGSTRTRRFQLRARLLPFVVLSYTSYP